MAVKKVTPEVRESAALSDEVVDHQVLGSHRDCAIEDRGPDHPLPAGSAGVIDDVRLNDLSLDVQPEPLAQELGKGAWDPVVAQVL